jgi:hypothetical protein
MSYKELCLVLHICESTCKHHASASGNLSTAKAGCCAGAANRHEQKHKDAAKQAFSKPVPTTQQVVSPGGFAMSLSGLRV